MRIKSMTMLIGSFAAIIAAIIANAGPVATGSVTVAAGETIGVSEITLNDQAAFESFPIDSLYVVNSSSACTGSVIFAAANAGVYVTLAETNNVAPRQSAAVWPRRQSYVAGSATNAETYVAHKIRVSVTQTATSEADAVYPFGVVTR